LPQVAYPDLLRKRCSWTGDHEYQTWAR